MIPFQTQSIQSVDNWKNFLSKQGWQEVWDEYATAGTGTSLTREVHYVLLDKHKDPIRQWIGNNVTSERIQFGTLLRREHKQPFSEDIKNEIRKQFLSAQQRHNDLSSDKIKIGTINDAVLTYLNINFQKINIAPMEF